MKKYISLLLIAFITITTQSQLLAYRYTFSNHTDYPLLVGAKLCCLFEDMMVKYLPPHKMITFVHGEDFPTSKFGFCLQSISCVINPTPSDMQNFRTAPFREMDLKWIKAEAYDSILNTAMSFGSGAAKAMGRLVSAAATNGVSLSAEAITKLAQQQGNSQPGIGERLFSYFGLGNIGRDFAKLLETTLCRDRHWDILQNENGTIMFVSRIQ